MSEELNQNPEVVTEKPTVEEPVNKPDIKTVTMTQDELNALISKEKGRVKSKFADYDELKTKIAEFEKQAEEKQRAEMTELERLQKDLEQKDQSAQSLAQQLEQLQSQIVNEKKVNAFIKAAPSVNIPSDRIDAALKLADLSAVKVEEGEVVGLDDVLKTLVDRYSFLADVKKPQKAIGEPTNGNPSNNDEVKTLEAQLEEAKKRKDFTKVIEISNKIKQMFK